MKVSELEDGALLRPLPSYRIGTDRKDEFLYLHRWMKSKYPPRPVVYVGKAYIKNRRLKSKKMLIREVLYNGKLYAVLGKEFRYLEKIS